MKLHIMKVHAKLDMQLIFIQIKLPHLNNIPYLTW